MNRLYLPFEKNEKLSCSFIRALQCSSSQGQIFNIFFSSFILLFYKTGKVLTLSQDRGIILDNTQNEVRLTHFDKLELIHSIDTNTNYDLQGKFGFSLG